MGSGRSFPEDQAASVLAKDKSRQCLATRIRLPRLPVPPMSRPCSDSGNLSKQCYTEDRLPKSGQTIKQMAIFIEKSTRCPLCSGIIEYISEAVAFPAMAWNELDPLWPISDAVVHTSCLRSHGLLYASENRQRAVHSATGPGKRPCKLCRQQIATPEEHITLGHLTDDESSPLHAFNLAQFHRSCLERSAELPKLISDLTAYNASGKWRGTWLGSLIAQLSSITPDSPPSAPHG